MVVFTYYFSAWHSIKSDRQEHITYLPVVHLSKYHITTTTVCTFGKSNNFTTNLPFLFRHHMGNVDDGRGFWSFSRRRAGTPAGHDDHVTRGTRWMLHYVLLLFIVIHCWYNTARTSWTFNQKGFVIFLGQQFRGALQNDKLRVNYKASLLR